MIGNLQHVTLFFLDKILYFSHYINKKLCLRAPQTSNIEMLQLLLLISNGFRICFTWARYLFINTTYLLNSNNLEAVLLVTNPIIHSKIKYFELDLYFVHDSIQNKQPNHIIFQITYTLSKLLYKTLLS